MSEEINNIAELFSAKRISIPVIQRDYAQGRKEEAVVSIRKNFIKSMLDASTTNFVMDLNFIYGINKASDDFLPIDGQQRLTSVFLFLWYSCVKGGETELFCKRVSSFSYQVRSSAEEFFDALQRRNSQGNDLYYCEDFKEYVNNDIFSLTDCSWFKFQWSNDNTVVGAITFLEDIKRESARRTDIKWSDVAKKLLDPALSPIVFSFVVQNENINSEMTPRQKEEAAYEAENRAAITYINMNERGKVLNDFENLKALLAKRDEAKEFINHYDNEYINVFMGIVEERKRGMSLSQKVAIMDELAINLLRHLYNDLCLLNDYEAKERNYYELMDELRQKERKIPEDYFDFLEFLLSGYKTYDEETRKVFYNYCNNHYDSGRFSFFNIFWEKYKKADQDEYFSIYKRHLKIDRPKNQGKKEFRFLVKLVNFVAEGIKNGKSVLETISSTEATTLYHSITISGLYYGDIIDENTLHEERVKAGIILWGMGQNMPECRPDMFEACGKRHAHRIQYLLKISGLWDMDFCSESLKQLLKYMAIDEEVFAIAENGTRTINYDWYKAYYLSAVGRTEDGKYLLPEKNEQTKWDDRNLTWAPYIEPSEAKKMSLSRIKKCFDLIGEYGSLENYILSVKKEIGEDRRTWLYYVLNREYDPLFENNTLKKDGDNNGYLQWVTDIYGHKDFYEYVLGKDIERKAPVSCVIFYKKYVRYYFGEILPEGKVKGEPYAVVCHRENDGFYNNRNMMIALGIRYDLDREGFYYIQKKALKKIEFDGFTADSCEDMFKVSQDDNMIPAIIDKEHIIISGVKKCLEKFGDDDYYRWVFMKDVESIEDGIKADTELRKEIDGFSVLSEGRNQVIINIFVSMKFNPQTTMQITHTDILNSITDPA